MRKIDRLVEVAEQDPVQLLRRGEVAAERLLDDDARALGAARLAELLDDRRRTARAGSRGSAPGAGRAPSSLRRAWNVAGSS